MLLKTNQFNAVRTALQMRSNKILEPYKEFVFEMEEFIQTFINPDHREKLVEVRDLVGDIGSTSAMTKLHYGPTIQMAYMAGYAPVPLLIPNYVRNGPQPTAPAEVLDRLNVWMEQRVYIGRQLGAALDMITWLNDNCASLAAFRVMFPAISILISDVGTDTAKKRANNLQKSEAVPLLPRLPREVKVKMQEISQLITATTLMGDVQSFTPAKPSTFSLAFYLHGNVYDKSNLAKYPFDDTLQGSFM